MCRRRFFKSNFYINYGGTAHGEAVTVSPFVAGGGSDTIQLVSSKPWAITNNTSWLSVSSLGNKSGTYSITLTASQNPEYVSRTGSFTVKTLDNRRSITVSVSQVAKTSEAYIHVSPSTVNMGAEDTYSSLICYLNYMDQDTQVTPAWSTNNTAVTISSNGALTSNNTGETPLAVTATATYQYQGSALTATAIINVSAATISRYITVSPQNVNIGPTGTQQLTVTYHEIINGHETTTDVTSSVNTTYSSNNPVISVNGAGIITANNQGGDTETATITISYPNTSGATVSVTSSSAVIVETVELSPNNVSVAYGDSQPLTVVYVKTVNGVETERRTITTPSQLTFTLSDNTAARMNGMNLVNQNVSDANKTENVYVTYNGIRSNTITATMTKPASLTYRLDVTADNSSIAYNGTTQMRATYVTVVNGTDYSSQTIAPGNVTWNENSSYASISAAGILTANNNSASTRTVTVTGTYNGVSGTANVSVGRKPALKVSTSSDWHLTSGAGTCVYTVSWVNLKPNTTITFNDDNLDSYNPTSISITSSNYGSGSQTITGTYSANNGANSRDLYLYATGTGQYNENLTSNDYYEQAGHNPTITYEIEVTPSSATLGYGETTALTVIYYVVTDGVRDAGTDVTSAATYSAGNSAATVSNAGVITGNNTGTSNTTTTIQVSYGNADPEDVTITSQAAVRTKTLTVTAANSSIAANGSTTVSAVYREYIGTTKVVEETPNATAVTWAIATGSAYASVTTAGTVNGTNSTEDNKSVTVRGTYKNVNGTVGITVNGIAVTYDSIRFASGSSLTNTITSVSLASAASKDNIYAVETRHGASDTNFDDTSNAQFKLFSGSSQLASFRCNTTGEKYSDDYITIYYDSTVGLRITSTNSETNSKAYRLTATDDNETATLNISVAAGAEVITYRNIYFVSGSNQYDITTVSIGATGSKNKIFIYRDRYVNGVYSNQVNDTTGASYTVYSGTTSLGTFTCSSTGQKYSDSNITISYDGTTNGIVIAGNNITESSKAYRLVASHDSYTDELGITVQAGSAEYRNLYFVSGANQYDLTTVSLTSAQTKDEVYVYTDKYVSGTKTDSVDANQIVDFSVYSGNTLLGTFDCKTTSGIKFNDNNGLRITYTISGLSLISQNVNEVAKTYTLTASYGSYSDSITINVAAAVAATYSLVLAVYTTGGTSLGGTVTTIVNNGSPNTGPLTPTRTISGLHSGDVVDFLFTPTGSSTYLKYSGTTTMGAANKAVSGVGVVDSFIFSMRAADTSDSENNVFRVDYSTKNGFSGTEWLTVNGLQAQTITSNLGSSYVTTDDDYFRYTIEKTAGRLNVSGWNLSGTNGTATNISTNTLNNSYLHDIDITQGKAGNIATAFRGSYPEPTAYTGTINFNASDATSWSSCNIILNNTAVLEGNVSPDSGTFTYTSTGQTFSCRIGGGIGDSEKYKRFSMEILDSNGNTLWDGPCRYLYASSLDYTALTLNAKQLNGSTWYLHNLANYGDISIYAVQSQTGVTGNTVAGYRNSVNVQFNWTGLTTGSTMTVTLPTNMTYQGSSTISIPVNSSNGNTTRLVNMPYNSGTTATGTDITYRITAVATDVNSDVIHGAGTLIHEYYQNISDIIQITPSSSIPYPGNNGAYGRIIWGQHHSDELDINLQCSNCSRIYISWPSDFEISKFYLTDATDGNGHSYIENDQYFYPNNPNGTVTLTTDVSRLIEEATESGTSGSITLTGYDSNGNAWGVIIDCDP